MTDMCDHVSLPRRVEQAVKQLREYKVEAGEEGIMLRSSPIIVRTDALPVIKEDDGMDEESSSSSTTDGELDGLDSNSETETVKESDESDHDDAGSLLGGGGRDADAGGVQESPVETAGDQAGRAVEGPGARATRWQRILRAHEQDLLREAKEVKVQLDAAPAGGHDRGSVPDAGTAATEVPAEGTILRLIRSFQQHRHPCVWVEGKCPYRYVNLTDWPCTAMDILSTLPKDSTVQGWVIGRTALEYVFHPNEPVTRYEKGLDLTDEKLASLLWLTTSIAQFLGTTTKYFPTEQLEGN